MDPATVAPLSDLPDTATAREAADRMSYADALRVASSILADLDSGKITKPYTPAQQLSLRAASLVFAREAETA